jgi:hypothetical protein
VTGRPAPHLSCSPPRSIDATGSASRAARPAPPRKRVRSLAIPGCPGSSRGRTSIRLSANLQCPQSRSALADIYAGRKTTDCDPHGRNSRGGPQRVNVSDNSAPGESSDVPTIGKGRAGHRTCALGVRNSSALPLTDLPKQGDRVRIRSAPRRKWLPRRG